MGALRADPRGWRRRQPADLGAGPDLRGRRTNRSGRQRTEPPSPAPADPHRLGPASRQIAQELNLSRRTGGSAGTLPGVVDQPGRPLWPFGAAAGVLVLLSLASPVLAQQWARRRRWAIAQEPDAAAEAAWRDVLDRVSDVDLRPLPTETPRDLARRLPRQGGLSAVGRAALDELARGVERARYAGGTGESGSAESRSVVELRALAATVRGDLLAGLAPRDRRRAHWWPASGRAQVAEVVGGVSARADQVMATVGRWGRSVSRRARRDDGPSALRSGA